MIPSLFLCDGSICGFAAPGNQIVLDLLDSEAFIPAKSAERFKALLMMAQGVGESMDMGFDPNSIAQELSKIGLQVDEHLDLYSL